MSFPHLFSPLQVGPIELPNRVLMSAMTTGFGYQRGAPDGRLLEYFGARAAGLGMVTVAFGAVRPEGRVEEQIPWMWRKDAAAVLAPLAARLHAEGARACLQLGHGGRQVSPRVIGGTPVAPSAIPPAVHVEVAPEPLTTRQVRTIVAAFAKAAARAEAAGFDAVEVHGGHGYLVQQFLSPASNRRDDAYGEDRARFGAEVVSAIRAAARSIAVFVRVNGSDFVPGGLGVEDAIIATRRFTEAGAHAIVVSAGVYGSVPYTIPLLDDPEGCFLDLAATVRRVTGALVVGVGRITTPEAAEAALARGDCDLVALGRALLADPGWLEKARRGETERIRPCIATVQGCAGMLQHGGPVSCQVNPEVGRESRPATARAPIAGRVAVVGGGPAGMEAALRAASLGHSVTLFERSPELGGALRLAASTPPLASFARLLRWYGRELETAGVELRLATEGAGLHDFDLVVAATGAATEVSVLDGYEALPTWTLEDLDEVTAERPAILGGASWAMAAALRLAAAGRRPALVSADGFGGDTSGLARRAFVARLARAGVATVRERVRELEAGGVRLVDGRLIEADGALLAGRRLPVRATGLPAGAIRVGDAREARGIGPAIAEARDAVEAWSAGRQSKSPPANQRA